MMLLHDAEWFVDDAARRMSLAQKSADVALINARVRIAEVLAFDKDAEIARAIEGARIEADRMAVELAKFSAQYEAAFAEIGASADTPAWAAVKDRAKILALDFTTVEQKFRDQVAAVAGVAGSAKTSADKAADLGAIQLITKG